MDLELLDDDILLEKRRLVDVALDERRPVTEPRPVDRYHTISRSFSLEASEVKAMGLAGVRDQYVGEVLRQLGQELREIRRKLGRKLVFLKRPLPANTTNRRVWEIEYNGVWVAVIAKRTDVPRTGRKAQRVIEFTVGTCVRLEGDREDLTHHCWEIAKGGPRKRVPYGS